MSQAHEVTEDDPYRWLEDVTGTAALDWVRDRNEVTLGALSGGPRFASLRAEAREVLDADDRIPFVRRRGEYLYNFWQDAEHPKGLWRRTTLEEYRGDGGRVDTTGHGDCDEAGSGFGGGCCPERVELELRGHATSSLAFLVNLC